MTKYIAKNKIVTVGGRDIRLSECTQEELAKLAKIFPSLIEADKADKPKTKAKDNDLPQPQPSEPDGSLNAE